MESKLSRLALMVASILARSLELEKQMGQKVVITVPPQSSCNSIVEMRSHARAHLSPPELLKTGPNGKYSSRAPVVVTGNPSAAVYSIFKVRPVQVEGSKPRGTRLGKGASPLALGVVVISLTSILVSSSTQQLLLPRFVLGSGYVTKQLFG
jgi:hypothetical protein